MFIQETRYPRYGTSSQVLFIVVESTSLSAILRPPLGRVAFFSSPRSNLLENQSSGIQMACLFDSGSFWLQYITLGYLSVKHQ